MLYHLKGDFKKSNEMLTAAEYAIEELYTKSISKGATSLLLNDNALDYSGADYEDVYLNVFKSLNYVEMNQFDNAFVEIRRINNKLSALEDKYNKMAEEYNKSKDAKKEFKPAKNQFNNSALGRYISMVMYRAEGKDDGAAIDLNKIKEAWQSQSQLYDFPMPNFDAYLNATKKAKVTAVSFIGKAPQLFARVLTIHTFKDAVGIYQSDGKNEKEIDLIAWPEMTSGYHFKFSLPYMEKSGSAVGKIKIEIGDKTSFELSKLESIENAAEDTYKLHVTMTYLKTIIRTVTKGILNEKANKELDKQTGGGFLGELTRIATSALVDASENADVRISRYFPAQAFVGEVEVEPGEYAVKINYYSKNGSLMYVEDLGRKTISTNALNFVHSVYLK